MTALQTATVHAQSQVAGFHYIDGGSLSRRLFYQNASGDLCAIMDDRDQGSLAGYMPSIKVKIGTPLASIFYSFAGIQSRNFFLNEQNEVCCFSMSAGSPGAGVLKDPSGRSFTSHPDSKLAAFMWVPPSSGSKPHIRVAFQGQDNCVQQINHDANDGFTFEVAAKSPPTLSGTSLAFLNQGPKYDNQYFRGYYQYENTVMELVNEPTSRPGLLPFQGTFTQSVSGKTKIGATYPSLSSGLSFGRGQGPVVVYWSQPNGSLSKRILNNNSWSGESALPSDVNVSGGGGFLPLSYCPANQLSPLKERVYWVANGKLWMKEL